MNKFERAMSYIRVIILFAAAIVLFASAIL